jgi:hypothetical protein
VAAQCTSEVETNSKSSESQASAPKTIFQSTSKTETTQFNANHIQHTPTGVNLLQTLNNLSNNKYASELKTHDERSSATGLDDKRGSCSFYTALSHLPNETAEKTRISQIEEFSD